MAEQLTPCQEMAVKNRGGALLVSAAAGSGKTKVLVDRLMSYLTDPDEPANIDDFLIITYTKAAAAELRGKIAAKLSEWIAREPENLHLQRQMQRLYLAKISTVHAFCTDILREYLYALDIPADFRMAEESECAELRQQVLDRILEESYCHPEPDFLAFVDTQGYGRTDHQVPQIIYWVYTSARCHKDPQAWLEGCLSEMNLSGICDPVQTPWGKFLLEDLFSFLDLQIPCWAQAVQRLEGDIRLQKYAVQLSDTLEDLRRLRASASWDEVRQYGQISFGTLRFPTKNGNPEITEPIKAFRTAFKEALKDKMKNFSDAGAQVLEDLAQSAPALRGLIGIVRRFSAEYDRLKRSCHVMDFGDLEQKALDLLLGKRRSGPTAAAGEIGSRFREIMVDEYQDSNEVQDAIFSVLTQKRNNLFLVGDVKQAIYQFRQADPEIFLEKYRRFVPAEQAQSGLGRKVLLSDNFRSSAGVIGAVNDVFSRCMTPEVGGLTYGKEEALREGIKHTAPSDPQVEFHMIQSENDTYGEEAEFVAERIAQLLDGRHKIGEDQRPIRPEDIMILLRAPKNNSDLYCQALARRGIACTAENGTDLLKTDEVGTLRSLLQIISNPKQDIPLVAVLASPVFGFTADELAAIRSRTRSGSFYDALVRDDSEKSREFCRILAVLRTQARLNTLSGLLEKILLYTRMDCVYGAMSDGKTRQANLQSFFASAASFERSGGKDLEMFLEHLDAAEAEKGLPVPGEQEKTGAVRIMSIHKSKGLEFPVVFLCELSRKFNTSDLSQPVLCHKSMGIGLSCLDRKNQVRYPSLSKRAIAQKLDAQSRSEELRVLYVAMTRAKDRLIMTFSARFAEKRVKQWASVMDASNGRALTGAVQCPGDWILMTALCRTEAGELFRFGTKPAHTAVSQFPWKITAVMPQWEEEETAAQVRDVEKTQEEDCSALRESLTFRYPYLAACKAPSKQTATQQKGRWKDQEASEEAQQPKYAQRVWRKPSFVQTTPDGKAYGSAIHAALQYIRYEVCSSSTDISQEISRLVAQGFLSAEQAKLVDCGKLAAFLETPVGEKLRAGKPSLREFKFSILDEAGSGSLAGEKVLLQGVVDCALVEPDGITVVDFKTDHVTEQTLPERTARYFPQVEVYARALSRIYGMPVKAAYLYFFHLDRLVPLNPPPAAR